MRFEHTLEVWGWCKTDVTSRWNKCLCGRFLCRRGSGYVEYWEEA